MKEACRILLDEETMAWGLPAHAQMHVYCLGQVVWCCGGTVKGRKRVVVAGRQGGVSSLLQVVAPLVLHCQDQARLPHQVTRRVA
jgi:hypothetical protein